MTAPVRPGILPAPSVTEVAAGWMVTGMLTETPSTEAVMVALVVVPTGLGGR